MHEPAKQKIEDLKTLIREKFGLLENLGPNLSAVLLGDILGPFRISSNVKGGGPKFILKKIGLSWAGAMGTKVGSGCCAPPGEGADTPQDCST